MKVHAGVVVAIAAVAALAGCSGGSHGSSSAKAASAPVQHPAALVGDVGHADAFTISLADDHGDPIRHLAAGTYRLTVKDESTIHDFHLTGAGVDAATPVGSAVTRTFTVTFKPGRYSFVCDPHASSMHGEFTVS